jgi:uncharacterized protein (DUF1697 family)
MTIYIALLRGINVGGKNMIKMTELKRILEAIGLGRVQTYIQSGNILFESNEEEDSLRKRIENQIEAVFSLKIPVIIRTMDELKRIAANCPFSEKEISEAESSNEGESLYVSLMLEEPLAERIERLKSFKSDTDEYQIVDRDIYLLFRKSIRNSKLANNLQKLDVPATVRNWKTINKLVSLAVTMVV